MQQQSAIDGKVLAFAAKCAPLARLTVFLEEAPLEAYAAFDRIEVRILCLQLATLLPVLLPSCLAVRRGLNRSAGVARHRLAFGLPRRDELAAQIIQRRFGI